MHLEVHGGGIGNLHVLGSMVSPWLYYERGLHHPFVDYDPPTWHTPPSTTRGASKSRRTGCMA